MYAGYSKQHVLTLHPEMETGLVALRILRDLKKYRMAVL